MPIKLLYDIELILNSGGKGTGLCRVCDRMLKELSSYPEYEIYPLVTKKTKYTAEEYLTANNLNKLIGNIVYLKDLRNTCTTASLFKRLKAWYLRLIHGAKYLKVLNSYDEYISPYFPISPLVYKSNLKTIIIVHDLISIVHPELCQKGSNLKKYELWMKDIKADKVICISQSTLNDFTKFRPDFDKKKLQVVHWGIDNSFKPVKNPQIRTKYGIKTAHYILIVSEISKRKNLPHLLKAFTEFLQQNNDDDISLVIVGPQKKNYTEVVAKMEEFEKIQDKIILTGFVADQDLPALYSEAEIFVFPSLYEGFGFPPLEAMACGTPVIVTDNSSLPEVCGDTAVYITGHDTNDTAQKIAQLHRDSKKREKMSELGLRHIRNNFNWTRTVNQIFDLKETL